MAWIESHQSLGAHPKTKKLCRVLGIAKPEAVGHLHLLWWWAMDYAQDGDLSRYEPLDIAIGAEWDGDEHTFVDALVAAGFLDAGDELRIHDWHDYAGKLIERRARNAERMREARADTNEPRATHVQGTQRARVQLPNQTVPNQTKPTEPGLTPPSPPKKIEEHARTIKTPIPPNLTEFIPSHVWAAIRDEQGMTGDEMRLETEKMVDHFTAKGERKVDWVAAWRNWMRSDFRKPRAPTPIQSARNGTPSAQDFAAMAREYERQGR